MNLSIVTSESAQIKAGNSKPLFYGYRKASAERTMKRKLEANFVLASGFKDNGVASGSGQFIALYRDSCDAMKVFSDQYETSMEAIALKIPALVELYNLTQPKPKTNVLFSVCAVAVLITALSIFFGTQVGLFHWVARHVGG